MFKKAYLPVKITALILMNLLLCLVFFILSAIPDHGIYMSSWHLELFLIWYPLTAIVHGIASLICAVGDRAYFLLMSVIFLAVAILNALTMGIVALPAAFVYTGIMLGAALIAALVKTAILAYVQYRNYKNEGTESHEQDSK